jgi:MFS family permease
MAATLLVLAGVFYAGASGGSAWVAVASVAAYVGFFAIGLGPVFWLLIAEIFPLALRGRAMSLATVANWGFNLIVAVTFLDLVSAFGSANAFLMYAVLSVVALIFVVVEVPETKGHTLEQIELDFERMTKPRAAALNRVLRPRTTVGGEPPGRGKPELLCIAAQRSRYERKPFDRGRRRKRPRKSYCPPIRVPG